MIRFFTLYFIYLVCKIKDSKRVKYNGFTVVYSFRDSQITMGRGITINSAPLSNLMGLYQRTILVARYGGKIKIGDNCGISGSTIYSMSEITIGSNVIIGGNCKIIDNDFHPLQAEKRINQKSEDIAKRPISIGDGCFIGANSLILKGTKLGTNCIVGAGSVVSGEFPAMLSLQAILQ